MKNLLEEIGLTQNETKVYLALNQLGMSTIGPIVDKAGISNSKIYIILEKLVQKGLVAHVLINNIKNYKTGEPSQLLDFLKEKKKKINEQEMEIERIIPQLLLQKKEKEGQRSVEVFEGFQGIKMVRERVFRFLKKGQELCILGASKFSTSQYEHYWENYHKRRISYGIRCRYLMYEETKSLEGKKREGWKLTQVRYMKKAPSTPIRMDIYGDYVDIAIDAQHPFVISIKSREIHDSFQSYFETLWHDSMKK